MKISFPDTCNRNRLSFFCGGLLGIFVFIILYGTQVLNPTYVCWIFGQATTDMSQHYFGWAFFRQNPWMFPWGMTDNLSYPLTSSVVFTDSIPHWAIFFKLLSPILPTTFQYFGWFVLISLFLQGAFAALIIQKKTESISYALAASLFFLLATPLYERFFYQTALGAQWLVLFGLYLYWFESDHKASTRILLWTLLLWLACGIHISLFAVCSVILAFSTVSKAPSTQWWISLLQVGIPVAVSAGALFLLGGLTSEVNPVGSTNNCGGLGYWVLNLNSLLNPVLNDHSTIIPTQPAFGEFWIEGYFYLGLGLLLLTIFVLILGICQWRHRHPHLHLGQWIWTTAMVLTLTILAFSPSIVLGDKVLFSYRPPKLILGVWEVFRASGRFFFPVYYMILIGVLSKLFHLLHRQSWRIGILCAALGLQIMDIGPGIFQHCRALTSPHTQHQSLSPEWDNLLKNKSTICFSQQCTPNTHPELMLHALEHHMRLNTYYFAHSTKDYTATIKRTAHAACLSPDTTTIYILINEPSSFLDSCEASLTIQHIDGYTIGMVPRLP